MDKPRFLLSELSVIGFLYDPTMPCGAFPLLVCQKGVKDTVMLGYFEKTHFIATHQEGRMWLARSTVVRGVKLLEKPQDLPGKRVAIAMNSQLTNLFPQLSFLEVPNSGLCIAIVEPEHFHAYSYRATQSPKVATRESLVAAWVLHLAPHVAERSDKISTIMTFARRVLDGDEMRVLGGMMKKTERLFAKALASDSL